MRLIIIKKLLIFVTSLFLVVAPAYSELPELGDPTRKELSPFEEYLMGKQFYQTLRSNLPFVEDLIVNEYLNTLAQRLVSQSDHPDKSFKFFILKIPNINAFAGPDGYIGIHTGLFMAAKNESELAGVLAHEISHVTQRHLARAMTESTTSAGAVFAAILAGILVSAQNPDAGAAIIYGSTAAMMQSQINFTRHNEYEADRIAIQVLRDAGINPQGMADFFETLLAKTESDNVLAQMEYLRTHPLSSTRVAESKHRLIPSDKLLPDDSLNFQLSKARITVAVTSSLDQLIKNIGALPSDQQNIVSTYMLAIALIDYGKSPDAIPILLKLRQAQQHPWFDLALARAYINTGENKKALELFTQLQKLYSNYLPVNIAYAQLLNDTKQYEETIQLLKKLLQNTKHPVVYQTLAQAYYAQGQVTQALEATSYQYELEGLLKLAAQQIENALKQPNLNEITRQRLESRKQILMQQLLREKEYRH